MSDTPQHRPIHREPLLFGLALALTVLGVAPIWLVDLLPLVDMAAHLHLMTVMHDLPHSPLLQQHYIQVHALVPYLSYYKAVDWLAYAMSIEQANRIVLSLTIAAMPWSAYVYLRTVGHSPWLLLGVLPWMLHCDFFMGFFSYLLSIPVFLLILAAHLRWLQNPTWRRGLLVAGLLGLLAVTHYLLWAVAMALLPGLALIFGARRGWWRAIWWPVRDALLLVPSLALLLPWFLRYFVFAEGVTTSDATVHKTGGSFLQRLSHVYLGEHIGPIANLRQIPDVMFDAVYRSDAAMSLRERPGEIVTVLWLVALALWFIGSARTPRSRPAPHERLVPGPSYAAWVVVLIALEYFIMPRNLSRPIALYGVNFRLVEVAMVLLICALPLNPRQPPVSVRWRTWLGAACMVAGAILLPLTTLKEFRTDRALMGDVRQAYDQIPVGKRVLTLRGRRPSRWFLFNIGEYYAVFRHGYVPYSFADTSSKPVVVNRQTALPAPPVVDLEFFNWQRHGRYYDYIVRFDEPGLEKPWTPVMPQLPVVWKGRGWTVWRNPSPDTWPPPTEAALRADGMDALAGAVRMVSAARVLDLTGLGGQWTTPVEAMLAATVDALPVPWPKPVVLWQESPRPWLPRLPGRPMIQRPEP